MPNFHDINQTPNEVSDLLSAVQAYYLTVCQPFVIHSDVCWSSRPLDQLWPWTVSV